MNFAKVLVLVGLALLILAWALAAGIPEAAKKDFDQLVKDAGGRLSHPPGFPDTYRRMSADRRLLQNVYLGAAGLICLGIGLGKLGQRAMSEDTDRSP